MYIYTYIHTHVYTNISMTKFIRVWYFYYIIYIVVYSSLIFFCHINSDYHSLITCNCQTLYLDFINTVLVCRQWEFIIFHFSNKETEAHCS